MFIFTAVCAAVNSTSPKFFASDKPRSFLDSQVWCEQHNASLARIDSLENEVEARKVIFQYLNDFHVLPTAPSGKATLVSGSGTKLSFWDRPYIIVGDNRYYHDNQSVVPQPINPWSWTDSQELSESPYPDSLGFWIGVVRPYYGAWEQHLWMTPPAEILMDGFLNPADFESVFDFYYREDSYLWLSKAKVFRGKWVSKHDSWFAFAWYDDTTTRKDWENMQDTKETDDSWENMQDTNIDCMSWSCVYATPYNWLPGNCDQVKKMALCERDALPNIPVREMAKFLVGETSTQERCTDILESPVLLSLFQRSVQMVIGIIAVLRFVLLVTISLRQIRGQKLNGEGGTIRVANDWNSPLAARVATIAGTYIATDIRNAIWSALIRTFVPAGALLMLHFNGPIWPRENFLATMIALMYFAAQNACMSAAEKAEALADYDAKILQSGMEGPKDWLEYTLAVYASWAVIFVVYLGSIGVATWGITNGIVRDYCFYWGLPFGSALIASAIATFLKWKGTCSNAIKAYRNLASNIADGTESPVQSRTATRPDGNMFIPEFLAVIAYVTLFEVYVFSTEVYTSEVRWFTVLQGLRFWMGILGLIFIWGLVTAIVSVAWYRCCARNSRLDTLSVSPLLRNEDAGTELTRVAVTPSAPSTSSTTHRSHDQAAGTELTRVAVTPSAPSASRTTHRSHDNDQRDAAVARRQHKIGQLDRQHKIIVELVESINSIFTIPLLVVIIIFATLGFFEPTLGGTVCYFAVVLGVVAVAASLGDDYTEAKAHVLGPHISRSLAKLMQDDPEQYSAYRDGLKQSLLGVQLFNLVVTTPRLLSTAFGLAFIKTAFEILKSLGIISSEHA